MGKSIAIIMTTGTNDPLKTSLAAITGMGMRKNGHTVSMFQIGEAGGVIDEDILRSIQGFGMPPMSKVLDDESMQDVSWYV